MENQENPILNLRQPLSMLGVIKETMNTIIRNRRPLQVILCLVILTYIQLQVATRYDSELLSEYFSIRISYEPISRSVNTQKNVTRVSDEQLMTKFHILFTSCCLLLYCAIITISSSYESYVGNTLSIRDAFFKPSRNWKRPLVTSGCILLLTMEIYAAYIFSFAVISLLSGRSHVDSSSLFYIAVLKSIFNAHMGALWMMSLVVTVLEDNMSGLKAINRAWELMKGKRVQISLLIMLYYGACLLVRKSFNAFSLIFEEWMAEEMWGLKVPFATGFDVFLFVFYAVLYHKCKMDIMVDGSRDYTDIVLDKSS